MITVPYIDVNKMKYFHRIIFFFTKHSNYYKIQIYLIRFFNYVFFHTNTDITNVQNCFEMQYLTVYQQ